MFSRASSSGPCNLTTTKSFMSAFRKAQATSAIVMCLYSRLSITNVSRKPSSDKAGEDTSYLEYRSLCLFSSATVLLLIFPHCCVLSGLWH